MSSSATQPRKFCNVIKLAGALPRAEVPGPARLAEAVIAKLRGLGVECCVLEPEQRPNETA